jgi:hypothetical protein
MGKGKLSQQLRRAIERAQHLNPNVNLYDYEVPAVVAGDKIEALIYNSTEGVKVVVRCEGCCQGRRHYRKATPKALSKSGALHCKMCLVGGRLPTPKGVKLPHTTEQRFIVVLWELGMDERFMFQVVPSDPKFWHRCMDFVNHADGFYVQVDGECHWKDMHGKSCEQVLDADFEQALAALQQGATLVRIHEDDLSHGAVVAATLAAAQGFVGVVLSPSYARQWVPGHGQKVLYTQALVSLGTNLAQSTGPTGVICILQQ